MILMNGILLQLLGVQNAFHQALVCFYAEQFQGYCSGTTTWQTTERTRYPVSGVWKLEHSDFFSATAPFDSKVEFVFSYAGFVHVSAGAWAGNKAALDILEQGWTGLWATDP